MLELGIVILSTTEHLRKYIPEHKICYEREALHPDVVLSEEALFVDRVFLDVDE